MKIAVLAIILLSIVFFGTLFAQQTIDARGTAMAFSNAANTRGLEQVGLNPATLALRNVYRFEFNILSINAAVRNNSFSKTQYDKYFTTGRFLNESDKNDILNSIPDDGLRGDLSARANSLAFYMPYFSLSLALLGNAFAKLPSELPDLLFNGNGDEGREYKIGDIEGDGWGGMGILISGAYPVFQGDKYWWNNVAVGATVKLIAGLGVFEVVNSEGILYNFDRSRERIFLMELMVDVHQCAIPLTNLQDILREKMGSLGMSTMFQSEDVFNTYAAGVEFDNLVVTVANRDQQSERDQLAVCLNGYTTIRQYYHAQPAP